MAGRWSSEQVVAEFRDLQASAMAVDQAGQLALLAGRRALAIVNLNKPTEILKKIPRNSKWEISAAQWNPHPSHAHHFITASNQRADLWSWEDSSSHQHGSLKAHTRVISDMDWSPTEPTQIATCSVDAYTYLWDTRDIRKPSLALQAVAGASQVQWNKVNSSLLATTHDGDIRIWDPRKGTSPVQYIAAHLAKIHGLDWSPTSEFNLATSSQDCTVKFWDVTNPKQPEGKLPSPSPVWRARYTPFGQGLVSVVVPQLRRGENSLFLWSLAEDQRQSAVHTFVGHTDVVLEFQWRKPDQDCADYQLVTWSKDQSLRLWRIDAHLQRLCGGSVQEEPSSLIVPDIVHSTPSPPPSLLQDSEASIQIQAAAGDRSDSPVVSEPVKIPKAIDSTDSGAKALARAEGVSLTPPMIGSVQRENGSSPHQPKTLLQEFHLANFHIANVKVDEMDAFRRTCTVSTVSGSHIVVLTMHFPTSYPDKEAPSFQFGKATTLDKSAQTKLIKVLCDTAKQHVSYNRSCIEPCLRQLVQSLEALTLPQGQSEERRSPEADLLPYSLSQQASSHHPPSFLPLYSYSIQDQAIPFPRTSGARFCGVGLLVCFSRRSENAHLRRTSSSIDATPRSMSALSAYSQTALTPSGSVNPILNIFNRSGMANIARSPPADNAVSLSNYYNFRDRGEPRKPRQRSKSRLRDAVDTSRNREAKAQSKVSSVVIYNVACLLPVHKQLAENYVLGWEDVPAMCRKNASVAASVGRKDLMQTWSLAAMASDKSLAPSTNPEKGAPWACHPFGRKMLKSLLDYYASIHDVQTLAMLCCTFGSKFDPKQPPPPPLSRSDSRVDNTSSGYNAYHTIHPSDTTLKGWTFTIPRMRRSNSCSDVFDETYRFEDVRDPAEIEQEQHLRNMRMLDASDTHQHDNFKRVYADLLYRWGLLSTRALVLKYVSTAAEPHQGLEFKAKCQHCHRETRGVQCWHCRNYVLQCAICHITVKGASSFCLACGHGGHSSHMISWFQGHSVCPTGCGCNCLQENPVANGP